jgi:hypothetical protein
MAAALYVLMLRRGVTRWLAALAVARSCSTPTS